MYTYVSFFFPREDWKPVLTISSVIYGLQFLFLVSDFYRIPRWKGSHEVVVCGDIAAKSRQISQAPRAHA